MRTLNFLTAAILATLTLTACASASAPTSALMPSAQMEMATQPASGVPAALERSSDSVGGGAAQSAPASQVVSQRMVIKTASISLQVDRVSDAEASIRARVDQLGGYVVSVQTNGSGDTQTSTIIFRVPSDSFGSALADVEGLARKVFSRTVGGDDVTAEFVDLDSRMRNLGATRDRLLALLAKADKVEEALQVNAALTDVQGQIEQIQGRMKYLKESAAMATITADLQPVPPTPAIIPDSGWQPMRVVSSSIGSLIKFGQGLIEIGIVLATWLIVWLPLLLLARWGWRRRASGKLPPTPPVA